VKRGGSRVTKGVEARKKTGKKAENRDFAGPNGWPEEKGKRPVANPDLKEFGGRSLKGNKKPTADRSAPIRKKIN